MKLGLVQQDDKPLLAALADGNIIDLSRCGGWKTVVDVISEWKTARPVLEAALENPALSLGRSAQWLAPIPHPPKFLLLAGNYRAHVMESGFGELPEDNMTPQFFMKPDTTIAGPTDSISRTRRNTDLDYEAELAVVVGERLKNASKDEVAHAIWGYTVVNDISERRLNTNLTSRKLRTNDEFFDWLTGKWFDGSAPMGPYVVTADEIPDPAQLTVRAFLNGEKVQEAPATAMVHSVEEAISYISQIVLLEPGDVISMGTPAGVGMARRRLLEAGDVIECEVDGIGRLSNRVVVA